MNTISGGAVRLIFRTGFIPNVKPEHRRMVSKVGQRRGKARPVGRFIGKGAMPKRADITDNHADISFLTLVQKVQKVLLLMNSRIIIGTEHQIHTAVFPVRHILWLKLTGLRIVPKAHRIRMHCQTPLFLLFKMMQLFLKVLHIISDVGPASGSHSMSLGFQFFFLGHHPSRIFGIQLSICF